VTLVTNALNIAHELTVRPNIRLVVTGGVARPQSYELIGPLAGRILDDITLPAALFPGLTEKIFLARSNTIYHLYQSRYGINVLRTDERLRAALATREEAQVLGVAEGAALLEIRRLAFTFRDRPVELRLSRVDSEHFEYHNTLGKAEPI